jgi:3-phosphoshikimate 1-carboxyvinyltransferase
MKKINGAIKLPGDKSISHRSALFSALRSGISEFTNFNYNEDCISTLNCLREMGIQWRRAENTLEIKGLDISLWRQPQNRLYAGNSGTTTRLMSGILSALPFESVIIGDSSLSSRPMNRVIHPLLQMNANIHSQGGFLPMTFLPAERLNGIQYPLPVASAQVKSAVLLAGLFAEGETEIIEFTQSRDHTERMLKLKTTENADGSKSIWSSRDVQISDMSMEIPGDISSAAFFIVAALMMKGSELMIENVSLNPSRTGILEVLKQMKANINIRQTREFPEPAGDLIVKYSQLENIEVPLNLTPNIIDEIPILAIAASQSAGKFILRGAKELRFKESDRIEAVVKNLREIGIEAQELKDGFIIDGPQQFNGGAIQTYKDHRIAMSFAIANLLCNETLTLDDPACVNVSFPDFWKILNTIVNN